MTMLRELPSNVVELLQSGSITEYATISAAGVPIDTPVLYFPSEGLQSIDLATGLSYPAKAERARKNPKVGLLIEGGPDEPVISIAGMAAVRDADLQANVVRYLSEAGHTLPGNPDWSLARQAVWYWTRIIIEVTPVYISWWDSPAAMNGPPQRWHALASTTYSQSDPAPPGTLSAAPEWRQPAWQELAQRALARGALGHLSVIDGEGYPLSIRARAITATEAGFALELPQGMSSAVTGKASFTFQGIETFIGEVTGNNGHVSMRVDRALPILPMTEEMTQLWEPTPDTRDKLMKRLRHETQRRHQPIPMIPMERPPPSLGYARRMTRLNSIKPSGS